MSKQPGASKALRASHATWDMCADLPAFIADGLFEFVVDDSYEFKASSTVPAAYKGKAGTIAAARLVCKELRAELDSRISDWMLAFHEKLVHLREKTLALQALPANFSRNAELHGPDKIKDFDRIVALEDEASKDFENHASSFLVDDIVTTIKWDVNSTDPVTLWLGLDVCTFMCMATQRCQVHGPIGKGRCRNMCVVSKFNYCVSNSNFSCINIGENRVCLYARDKCLDSVCIKPDPRFLANADNSLAMNTARNMFRSRGVYHPFPTSDVIRATNAWGTGDPPLWLQQARGVRMATVATWPRKIFLTRHPAVPYSNSSIQQVLGITDEEARACRADAIRKSEQKTERERIMNQRIVEELVEDLDVYMESTRSIPVNSMEALAEICPGMDKSIRIAVRDMHHSRHALDIDDVRNALGTVSFFLGPVLEADAMSHGEVASSEAYDFVSQMHFGRYGVRCPGWRPIYASMKTDITNKQSKISDSVLALRFFDALDESSLCVAKSRQRDTLPEAWMLSAGAKTIVFDAVFYASYDDYLKLHDQVSFLLTESNLSVRLPKLFPKLVHTYATTMIGNRKQCSEIKDWVMKAFKLLVTDPVTRCAALDIINLVPSNMAHLVGTRSSEK